mgnify:CR=1 FL=1
MFATRSILLFAVLVTASFGALLVALGSGSANIGIAESLAVLWGEAPEQVRTLVVDLRLPRAEGGTLAFKECRTCDYVRLRVAADTRYQINGKAVPLKEFRAAVAEVQEPGSEPVTVLHHLKRNQVTAVSVNL